MILSGKERRDDEYRGSTGTPTLDIVENLIECHDRAILVLDTEFRIRRTNKAFERLTGYGQEELKATRPWEALIDESEREQVQAAGESGKYDEGRESRNLWRRKSGETEIVRWSQRAVRNVVGEIEFFIWALAEEGQTSADHVFLRHAFFDSLTGLSNRHDFMDHLRGTVARRQAAGRERTNFAVVLVDLDGFGLINASLGHVFADQVLVSVARRIQNGIQRSHMLARYGNDEFALLIPAFEDKQDVVAKARELLSEIARPMKVNGTSVHLTASAGIACFERELESLDGSTPIRAAVAALNRARYLGRGQCVLFERTMHRMAVRRLRLENEIRRALENDEFLLYYQPIMDAKTGRVSGMEALTRWDHPKRGILPPSDYIAVAEEAGLISALGESVLREACRSAAIWSAAGDQIGISVNVSPRQFFDPEFIRTVEQALAAAKLPGEFLTLEITENLLIGKESDSLFLATIAALRDLDIRIALDDFGSGYSSLSYLSRFPANILKIDRAFVMGLPADRECGVIVRTILNMAHMLGLDVTAEGVETPEQAELLRQEQCDFFQGYYFSRPLDFAGAERFLGERESGASAPG